MSAAGHVCTCGDCGAEPFSDACKFEAALREILPMLERTKAHLSAAAPMAAGISNAQALITVKELLQ